MANLPRIVPILKTSRVIYELRATSVDAFDWCAVSKAGDLLCAIISPVGYVAMRDEVYPVEDAVTRCYKFIELARVEVFFEGAPVGGIEAIPEAHHMSLAAVVARLSQRGVDPFFGAPVASQP